MTDPVGTYALVCGSAFAAGAMNSIAGGGTLLTFPALLAVMDPAGANATSTVALMPGSLAGAAGYRRELAACRRFVLRMLAPSVAGGYIGAWLVGLAPEVFADLVPWLILTAAVLFLLQHPLAKLLRKQPVEGKEAGPGLTAVLIACQFLIAVYGGYFGAGIGILMLTALGFMGVGDIHRMNAVKTILATAINAAAVVKFVADGLVTWGYALPMAGAAILGGYAGARTARRLPASYVRWIVIAVGFGLAAYYFAR